MKENQENHRPEYEDIENEQSMTNEQSDTAQNIENNDNMTDWESKYNDIYDSYIRLNAEFDNYRKRTLKEKSELLKTGSEKVLIDLINIIDDFERALSTIQSSDDIKAIKEGIDLIYGKFLSFLIKHDIKEIETIGQTFDVEKHEALTSIPADSDENKDKIVDCVQKGYTLNDKVIRYPKVIVAK